MTITLREITKNNWDSIARLEVADNQRGLVASNAYSIVEAHYQPEHHFTPLAIYDDETPVGFVMYGFINYEGAERWTIVRLMVDHNYQRKGYARAGMQQLIEQMRMLPNCDAIYIIFALDNIAAKELYTSLGFIDAKITNKPEFAYKLQLST